MIAVVGEALIDLISAQDGTYRATPGGAPANTAVALARLGVPVQLLARNGSDRFGRQLRNYLAGRGVDISRLVAAEESSTLAIADLSPDGHAEYGFYIRGTADWQWQPHELPESLHADALHTGSLALALPPGSAVLEEWIARQRPHTVVSYDPNIRPSLAGDPASARERVERQLALADVVKASDEDLEWLYPDRSVAASAHAWAEAGPALIVVTQGEKETLVLRSKAPVSERESRHAPPRVELVDTVGAGDAFAAGLLDALGRAGALGASGRHRLTGLAAREVAACVDYAHQVAARTCERVGADPGPLEPNPPPF